MIAAVIAREMYVAGTFTCLSSFRWPGLLVKSVLYSIALVATILIAMMILGWSALQIYREDQADAVNIRKAKIGLL